MTDRERGRRNARRRPPPPGEIRTELGKRLRQRRIARGLSQAALGAPFYTRAMISAVELGKVGPSLAALRHFASQLRTSIEDLAGPGETRPEVTGAERAPEIRHATMIRAEPRVVYDLIATAAGLDRWFTQGAELDPEPGGRILFRWEDWGPERVTTESAGTVHEARPHERFVFDWDAGSGQQVTVEFDIQPVERGVVLRLRESGYDASPEALRRLIRQASGWGEAMTLIKLMAEHDLHY